VTARLVLVALGPVQDFIAQARRTRDLWFGSHLLSELSRAVARELVEEREGVRRAELIFPALKRGDHELEPEDAPVRVRTGRPPVNVANKILAELDADDTAVKAAVRAARAKANERLQSLAANARKNLTAALAHGPDVDAVWNEQIETLLDFNTVWMSVVDGGGYKSTRDALERALSARKNLRDFAPWRASREGVPKSSLDGARETVLARFDRDDPKAAKARRRYRLGENEQLDAIGVTKRAGGEPEQFVPIARVALASWISEAQKRSPGELEAILSYARDNKLSSVRRGDIRWVGEFPADAQVFLEDRWRPLAKEFDLPKGGHELRQRAGAVLARMPRPHPYVACLVADGDHMGAALDTLTDADEHRRFSAHLAEFADAARTIVERDAHQGALVYSGGDDVLAFVCLTGALACARALKDAFAACMRAALPGVVTEKLPTLSVGVGVGHLMESMGHLLDLGRSAEKLAKGNDLPDTERRNALAVKVEKRAGVTVAWRARWESDPVATLGADARRLEEGFPLGKVYEVRALVERLPRPAPSGTVAGVNTTDLDRVLVCDVRRTLARADAPMPVKPEDIGLEIADGSDYAAHHRAVTRWCERMLVARMFQEAKVGR
jgi:CRISPR-associated protein Cmr2